MQVARHDLREAERTLRRAFLVGELGPGSALLRSATLANRGALRLTWGRSNEAEPFLEHSLEMAQRALGPDHPGQVRQLQLLADCYRLRNRPSEAEDLYERALELAQRQRSETHTSVIPSLAGLGLLAELRGHDERAEWFHQRALAIAESSLGPNHPDHAVYLSNLGRFYRKHGEAVQAEPLYLRAVSVLKQNGVDSQDPRRVAVMQGLASVYSALGRRGEAARIERRLKATPTPTRLQWEEESLPSIASASSTAQGS